MSAYFSVKRHFVVILCMLAIVCISAILQYTDYFTDFRYQRSEISSKAELWRLWTGHWLHLSWNHWLLNALTAVILQLLFIRVWRSGDWLFLLVIGAPAVSLGFWFFQPQLSWYVGLSGLLHGVWMVGALRLIQMEWQVRVDEGLVKNTVKDTAKETAKNTVKRHAISLFVAGTLLLSLIIKLVYEQTYGSLPWSESTAGGNVIVVAHLYGALFGIVHYIVGLIGLKNLLRCCNSDY